MKENMILQKKEYDGGEIIDVGEFKELHPIFFDWLENNMTRFNSNFDKFIIVKTKNKDLSDDYIRVKLFTSEHEYSIAAEKPNDKKEFGYLGCIVKFRKNRPGVNYSMGTTIHDGTYSESTFNKIMCDIVSCELVK